MRAKVNCKLSTNPIIYPPRNPVIETRNKLNLLPMPSRIRSMSLRREEL